MANPNCCEEVGEGLSGGMTEHFAQVVWAHVAGSGQFSKGPGPIGVCTKEGHCPGHGGVVSGGRKVFCFLGQLPGQNFEDFDFCAVLISGNDGNGFRFGS